jgi:small nuclear ribonucleoprotein (snRNP)-like protein
MAYDRHMNLVLGDAEEFRKLPPKKGSKEEVRARVVWCAPLPVNSSWT